jgi:hypothetical protein
MNVQEDPLVDETRGVNIRFFKGMVIPALLTIKPGKAAGFDGVTWNSLVDGWIRKGEATFNRSRTSARGFLFRPNRSLWRKVKREIRPKQRFVSYLPLWKANCRIADADTSANSDVFISGLPKLRVLNVTWVGQTHTKWSTVSSSNWQDAQTGLVASPTRNSLKTLEQGLKNGLSLFFQQYFEDRKNTETV